MHIIYAVRSNRTEVPQIADDTMIWQQDDVECIAIHNGALVKQIGDWLQEQDYTIHIDEVPKEGYVIVRSDNVQLAFDADVEQAMMELRSSATSHFVNMSNEGFDRAIGVVRQNARMVIPERLRTREEWNEEETLPGRIQQISGEADGPKLSVADVEVTPANHDLSRGSLPESEIRKQAIVDFLSNRPGRKHSAEAELEDTAHAILKFGVHWSSFYDDAEDVPQALLAAIGLKAVREGRA